MTLNNGDTNICATCSGKIRFDLRHPDGDGQWRHIGQVFGEPNHSAEPANLEEPEFRDPVTDPEVEVSPPDRASYLKSEAEQAIEVMLDLAKNAEDPIIKLDAAQAILSHVRFSNPPTPRKPV